MIALNTNSIYIDPDPPRHISRPILLQEWKNVCFVHWPCEPPVLQARLPLGLQLDTFDGVSWLGFTPFQVEHFRPSFLPATPWLSSFAEINARTYVRGPDGEPAVWFLSLEADRLIPALGAKLGFSLPYKWARVKLNSGGSMVHFSSKRSGAEVELKYVVGSAVSRESEFQKFLTARFKMFTVIRQRLHAVQIEHARWPLQNAWLLDVRESLSSALGVRHLNSEPHIMYSSGVSCRIGAPVAVDMHARGRDAIATAA
jgi:uncharacterized protein